VSLRYAILGLLQLAPSTGYELTQRFDDSLSHAWHAGHSQIYPELSKLEEAGLVEVVGEGARNSRTFGITDQGRTSLRDWLTETTPSRHQRNETALRWFLVFLLPPDDRRAVLERELAHVEAHDAALRAQGAELDAQGRVGGFRPVMELGFAMNGTMLAWLRAQVDAAS
jgi:PadR family transcriptional regulator, regulatory protein AphA